MSIEIGDGGIGFPEGGPSGPTSGITEEQANARYISKIAFANFERDIDHRLLGIENPIQNIDPAFRGDIVTYIKELDNSKIFRAPASSPITGYPELPTNEPQEWFVYDVTVEGNFITVTALSNNAVMFTASYDSSVAASWSGWKDVIGTDGMVYLDRDGINILSPESIAQNKPRLLRITSQGDRTYIQAGLKDRSESATVGQDKLVISAPTAGWLDEFAVMMSNVANAPAVPKVIIPGGAELKFYGEFNKPDLSKLAPSVKAYIDNNSGSNIPDSISIPDSTDLKTYFVGKSTGFYKSGYNVVNAPNGKTTNEAGWYSYQVIKHDSNNSTIMAFDSHGSIYTLSIDNGVVNSWKDFSETYASLDGASFTDTISAPQIEVNPSAGEIGLRATSENGKVVLQPTDDNGDSTPYSGKALAFDGVNWTIGGKIITTQP